jgi:ferredoxin
MKDASLTKRQIKIVVDRGRCVSSGQCAATSMEIFGQGEDDGVVILRNAYPGPELEERARLASALCPSGAILIEELK